MPGNRPKSWSAEPIGRVSYAAWVRFEEWSTRALQRRELWYADRWGVESPQGPATRARPEKKTSRVPIRSPGPAAHWRYILPTAIGRQASGGVRINVSDLRPLRWLLSAACLVVALPPDARAAAFTLTGVVRNEQGQGVANVDLDFLDKCTGDNVFLVNDKTTASGAYSIVVNEGQYDIHFTPPAGSTLTGAEIKDYIVAASANLGTTMLATGRLVSGTVRNGSGAGIAGVDLKFVDVATGSKVWVTKDVTDLIGAYSVRVAPGTYDIEYRPPATTTFVTVRRASLVVGVSDISGLVDVLPVGFQVDGTVKDVSSVPVKNVDLNFYDNCSGEKIPTANDNTDVQGNYAIYVPAGTYSVRVNPPACKILAAERIPGVRVDNDQGIGDTILQPGLLVSGRVLDEAGQPLANAKIKFYDAATGSRRGATRDDTDAAGNFSILMPEGTFNINVEPPSSRDLLVGRLDTVAVAGATPLGDVALQPGHPLTGLVHGPGGVPVQNVDIDVLDSVTRARVILAHDSTAPDGTFGVVVRTGTFDVQYEAPICTGLAPDDQKAVTVAGPTALPTKLLVVGVHATGLVVDDAGANPVDNADLDFFPAGSSVKSYTPGDTTDATGSYDVLVKPDVYDINYKPASGSRLRPARRLGAGVLADVTLPDTVLPSGWLLSGTVHAQATGLPVGNMRIDVFTAGGGALAWTPHNGSAADGSYLFSVDAGAWDVQYVPPDGSGLAPLWRRGVTVAADLPLGDTLLLPLTMPVVSTVTPASGTTRGGAALAIGGSGFQPDATVRIGGVAASAVSVVSSSSINAVTGPHPAGKVAVEVINPESQVGALASAYSYVEPASPVAIQLAKSGADVVLTWQATGQAAYSVFRSPSPSDFSAASIVGTTSGTTFIDGISSGVGEIQFYNVD